MRTHAILLAALLSTNPTRHEYIPAISNVAFLLATETLVLGLVATQLYSPTSGLLFLLCITRRKKSCPDGNNIRWEEGFSLAVITGCPLRYQVITYNVKLHNISIFKKAAVEKITSEAIQFVHRGRGYPIPGQGTPLSTPLVRTGYLRSFPQPRQTWPGQGAPPPGQDQDCCMAWAVCLLCSRRRTFLFCCILRMYELL